MRTNTLTHSYRDRPAHLLGFALAAVALLGIATLHAGAHPNLLDDFSDPVNTSAGTPRIVVTDEATGGQSVLNQRFAEGVLIAEGVIAPGRGTPGWVSLVLMVSPDGSTADLSQYEGIRIRARVQKGFLFVSANSADIDNFDYHSALVSTNSGQELQEVKIAFSDMKRAWSEQKPLNTASIASVSLVAVNMQKADFAYAIDEIGFY